jgi:hypothetical protein
MTTLGVAPVNTGPRREPAWQYEIPTHRINKVDVNEDIFEAIHSGEKKFYIDRVSFKKGHYILFREYDAILQDHTDRSCLRLISWVCDDIRYMAGGHTCYSLADADEARYWRLHEDVQTCLFSAPEWW